MVTSDWVIFVRSFVTSGLYRNILLDGGGGLLDLHPPACFFSPLMRRASRAHYAHISLPTTPRIIQVESLAHLKAQLRDFGRLAHLRYRKSFDMESISLSSLYRVVLFVYRAFLSMITQDFRNLFDCGYSFASLSVFWLYLGMSSLVYCFPSLLLGGGSLWVNFICSFGFDFWKSGCLPFTWFFLFSILICSIFLTCTSDGLWLRRILYGLVCWCSVPVSCRCLIIAGGDTFVALVNHSVESDIRSFGCLPFSRDFCCLVYPCLISLACDYVVWLQKWCLYSRSTAPVSVYIAIITWASDISFDLRAISTFVFVNATVVLAYTVSMRVCFELVTTEVRLMVVDLLSFVLRLEYVFLKDQFSLTLRGLCPLLQWHLRFWFTMTRSYSSRVFWSSFVSLCIVAFCISLFGFGWSNPNTL